jgi:hypothetical protein
MLLKQMEGSVSELAVKPSVNESDSVAPGLTRRIVSYFDHEYIQPSLNKVERDVDEMTEAGFTNVVLCITEKDIASQSRLDFLTDTVGHMKDCGLEVWADPWSVGSVFGGEAGSSFKDDGEKRCMCNPKLDTLIRHWLDASASTGIDTVFWDEPEMKDCRKHRSGEVKFIEKYTAAAGKRALKSVVCLCADYSKMHQFAQVANLPDVTEIATDPYFPYPFRYPKIPEDMHLEHIEKWADFTRATAEQAGIDWHIWVQTFGIPNGRESMVDEHIDTLRARGVGSIAVWGFHGCESVPGFAKETDASPDIMWRRITNTLARS